MLSVIMLSVVKLSVIVLNVILLSVIMLNVIMLDVIMPSVVAPKKNRLRSKNFVSKRELIIRVEYSNFFSRKKHFLLIDAI